MHRRTLLSSLAAAGTIGALGHLITHLHLPRRNYPTIGAFIA